MVHEFDKNDGLFLRNQKVRLCLKEFDKNIFLFEFRYNV